MKLQAYSIYDKQSATFSPPFLSHTDELAIRYVRDEIAVAGSLLSKYPSDYTIYRIGNWYPCVELPLTPFEPENCSYVAAVADILGDHRNVD